MRFRRLLVTMTAAASAACGAFSGTQDAPPSGDAGASITDGSASDSVDGGGGTGDAANDSSSDAADDGAPLGPPCTPRTPVKLLTGDFDSVATYSVLGTSYSIPSNTSGASAAVMAPGASGTAKALHIHSTGDKYVLEAPVSKLVGGVCVVTSTFDIKFDGINAAATGDPTFAIVGVRNPAFDHCYVYFQYFKGQNKLGLQSHCGIRPGGGDYNASTMPLPAFPAGFVHVVLTLDLSKATASLVVGGTTADLPLQTNQVLVGGPEAYAEIGLDGTGPGFDGTIDLDSIDVEAR